MKYLFALLILPAVTFAQSTLELEGISFPCQDCRELAGGQCEIILVGSPVLLPCEEAFAAFLKRASRDDNFKALLDVEDLKRALFHTDSLEHFKVIYSLLGGTIIYEAFEYNRKLTIAFLDSLSAGEAHEILEQTNTMFPAQWPLTLRLLKKAGDASLYDRLFPYISVADDELTNLVLLRHLNQEVKSAEIAEILQAVDICLEAVLQETLLRNQCSSKNAARNAFLERLRMQRIRRLASAASSPVERLLVLQKIDFENGLLPSHHALLEESLEEAPALLADPRFSQLFRIFAEKNSGIRAQLESFQQTPTPSGIPYWLLGLFLIPLPFFFRRRRVRKEGASINDIEISNLLSDFGLTNTATERELSLAYRRLAKEKHPDTPDGDDAGFLALKAKYERARSLLIHRSTCR